MRAFTKKEIMEIVKTYRLWVVPVFFLFLGFSAPASAKFLPEILESQLRDQNITLKLPEPSAIEAYQQYFKNLSQMGLIAVILLSMGLISTERDTGVLAQLIAKPIRRSSILLSKWLVHGSWFVVSMILGAIGCYFYTLGLFGQADLGQFVVANLVFGVYLLLIFSLTVAASSVFSNQIGAGAVALGAYFVLSLIPMLGKEVARFSPATLNSLALEAVNGKFEFADALIPLLSSVAIAAAALIVAGLIFQRQEL